MQLFRAAIFSLAIELKVWVLLTIEILQLQVNAFTFVVLDIEVNTACFLVEALRRLVS